MERFLLMASELERTPPGGLIRAARKERGWSQDHLAQLLGTTRMLVIRWETGRGFPGEKYRPKLAAILDIDEDRLRRPEPTPDEMRSLEERLRDIEAQLEAIQRRLRVY